MAEAALSFEDGTDGRSWFRVEADPFDAAPFTGPAKRTWDRFLVDVSGDGATYEWRSGVDGEVARAKAVLASRVPDDAIARYLERSAFAVSKFDEFLLELEEADGLDPETLALGQLEAIQRRFVEAVADGHAALAAAEDPHSFYDPENDRHLADAAGALSLPPWASVEEEDDGGMGSGYTAPFLVLEAGRTLSELAAWLASKADGLDHAAGAGATRPSQR